MSDTRAGRKQDVSVEVLVALIREHRIDEVISTIDFEDGEAAARVALTGIIKKLYRDYSDVTNMVAAGKAGLAYCLRRAARTPDETRAKAFKRLGRDIAFDTAANCWPGWGDAGVTIEAAHVIDGLELAAENRNLVLALDLVPREQGGADWLIGALELAAGRTDAAQRAFEQAERVFAASDLTAYALMARGYGALSRKADPQLHAEGERMLADTLAQLKAEGSRDARFFADQLATAERLLIAR